MGNPYDDEWGDRAWDRILLEGTTEKAATEACQGSMRRKRKRQGGGKGAGQSSADLAAEARVFGAFGIEEAGIELDAGPWAIPDAEPDEKALKYDLGALIAARHPRYRAFVQDFLRALDQSDSFEDFALAVDACNLPGVQNPPGAVIADVWEMATSEKGHPEGWNKEKPHGR